MITIHRDQKKKKWIVVIDFMVTNGFEREEREFDKLQEGLDWVSEWSNTVVKM